MNDEQAHDIFSRIADDPAPPLGFTADGLAAAGRRGARRRRIGTVAGTSAAVVAVGVAVATAPGFARADKGSVAAPGSTSVSASAAAPDPECVRQLAKSPMAQSVAMAEKGNQPPGQVGLLPKNLRSLLLTTCPALRDVLKTLDPQGGHLSMLGPDGKPAELLDIPKGLLERSSDRGISGLMSSQYWTRDGKVPGFPTSEGLPFITIQVQFEAAGEPDPMPKGPDMALAKLAKGVASPSVPWGSTTTTTIEDGSTVTVKKTENGPRVALYAIRTLPSGAHLTAFAWDAYDPGNFAPGDVIDPFPITEAQMVAAVSVAGVAEIPWPAD